MTSDEITIDEARRIGVEAYTYLYSLVTMEMSRRQLSNGPSDAQPGRGPMGMFHHVRAFPDADFKAVVRPNFDTLYSSAWLDLAAEPMIVSVPEAGDRYYLVPCLDMWTDVFASPGSRTSGPGAYDFALCAPGWDGPLPAGVDRIDAPTPTVWVIGRIQTNGPSDYAAVNAFQDQMRVTPLSSWGGTPPAPTVVDDPAVDTVTPPLDQVNSFSAAEYFALGAELMAVHPPHLTDWSTLARIRRIGLVPGEVFDLAAQAPAVQEALAEVPKLALGQLLTLFPRQAPVIDGWMNLTSTMGVYGNAYVRRAVVAMVGLGANQEADAIYPVLETDADGAPLDGANRYVLHFDADALPPVGAFWSVTMYDEHGFQAANEIDRFAIGDRDELHFAEDGSLDLFLQHDDPGGDRTANWLPAPLGPLGVTLRLYEPLPAALDGSWTPPAVRRVP